MPNVTAHRSICSSFTSYCQRLNAGFCLLLSKPCKKWANGEIKEFKSYYYTSCANVIVSMGETKKSVWNLDVHTCHVQGECIIFIAVIRNMGEDGEFRAAVLTMGHKKQQTWDPEMICRNQKKFLKNIPTRTNLSCSFQKITCRWIGGKILSHGILMHAQ